MNIRDLEHTAALRILIYLLKNPEGAPMRRLVLDIDASQTAIYRTVRILTQAGLLEEHRERKFPRRRLIRLTSKGCKVAEILTQIQAI